jgi:hypothetical protein
MIALCCQVWPLGHRRRATAYAIHRNQPPPRGILGKLIRWCQPRQRGARRDRTDEALTSAAQAATIILEGVKADRWRILVGADAHKIDEMVRQSPERAYDIAFFDEFARAAGWTERLSLENPDLRPPN